MWQERIEVNPAILVGKPVIKGTRLAVEFLLDLMPEGWPSDQILRNYPRLTADDLQAAMASPLTGSDRRTRGTHLP